MYEVIDNFLPSDQADLVETIFLSNKIYWRYSDTVASINDNEYFYFQSTLKNTRGNSTICHIDCLSALGYVLQNFSKRNLLENYYLERARLNLYVKTDKIIHHNFHTDDHVEHIIGLYYPNTNNGYTRLKINNDIIKIDSVKNRMVIIDGSIEHASSTCTDKKVRVSLNLNFFPYFV